MQWWTIGDDTVIDYYHDNLYHCVIQSQIIILFKDCHFSYFFVFKMKSIVTLKILGEITHAHVCVYVCACICAYEYVHACMNVCVHAYACMCVSACVCTSCVCACIMCVGGVCMRVHLCVCVCACV